MYPKTSIKLSNLYPCWPQLEQHRQSWEQQSLRDQFKTDKERGHKLTLEAAGLYLDYSKNHLTRETLDLFAQLASEAKLDDAIQALLAGAGAARRFRNRHWPHSFSARVLRNGLRLRGPEGR